MDDAGSQLLVRAFPEKLPKRHVKIVMGKLIITVLAICVVTIATMSFISP